MTKTTGKAQAIGQTYIDAIARKDVGKITSISTDDVLCNSPLGTLTGLAQFRDFQEGFARMITNVTVLAVYGDDEQAVVIYDAETYPVPHSIIAELIKVRGDKLASTEVIYDSAPFAEYVKSVQPH